MGIENRIRSFLKQKGIKSDELAEKTGIGATRWNNARRSSGRIKADEVEAICRIFPEYALWIATGNTIPEAGQISPEVEDIADDYGKTGTDTK